MILHVLLNPGGGYLLPLHVPLHLVPVHIHNDPDLDIVGDSGTSSATGHLVGWTVLPDAPSLSEIGDEILALVRVLVISSFLVDDP